MKTLWGLLVSLLVACVDTTLATPALHPANPAVHAAAPAAAPAVLAREFDPFTAYPAEAATPPPHQHARDGAVVADPHAHAAPAPATPAADAAVYTCPMHPEIVRGEPGSCPICGMKLVPKQGPKSEH